MTRFRVLGCVQGELAPMSSVPLEKANTELKAIQFRAVTAFNRLRDDVGRLGSQADTPDLRRRIADSTQRFGELAQQFKESLSRHPKKDGPAAQKIIRDFQGLLKNSERLMTTAKEKEAATLPRLPASAALESEQGAAASADLERQALLEQEQKQQLLRVENELKFNEAMIEERDHAITEITGQIGEVHQIFQDLAVLVNDQGEMLDDIEANITRASERTQDAHTQIVRAERSQRRSRKTWCFATMLAVGALAILLLIVLA